MKQVVIFNKWFPFKGFVAMTIFNFLFIRKEFRGTVYLSSDFYRHEMIHTHQQVELFCLGLVVQQFVWFVDSYQFLFLLSPFILPFVLYFLSWLLEIALPPVNHAYKNICFESEAVYNEWDIHYLETRKLFAFLKFISNKKYPALSYYDRQRRNKKRREAVLSEAKHLHEVE